VHTEIIVALSGEKRPLGRPRRRLENINVDRINLAQDCECRRIFDWLLKKNSAARY
jgi:hypothetical protein